MSDNEIKLTNADTTTVNGVSFPQTPPPQVLNENFASIEINNDGFNHGFNYGQINNNNFNTDKDN